MVAHYHQSCPAARTLEIVGERWTLLLIRELLAGPARFQVLQDALPGCAPNLLTERLRRLQEAGVLVHVDRSYALTEAGRELAPLVAGLFV